MHELSHYSSIVALLPQKSWHLIPPCCMPYEPDPGQPSKIIPNYANVPIILTSQYPNIPRSYWRSWNLLGSFMDVASWQWVLVGLVSETFDFSTLHASHDFIPIVRIWNVAPGNSIDSAWTDATTPMLARAPRIRPAGKYRNGWACAIIPSRPRSKLILLSGLNELSVRTYTPYTLWND